MAKWRKKSLMHALEGSGIAKGVGKELMSIATFELCKARRSAHEITIKYPNGKVVKIRR